MAMQMHLSMYFAKKIVDSSKQLNQPEDGDYLWPM